VIASVELTVQRYVELDADEYRRSAVWDLGGMSPQPE
jgi:hypothetical protein